MLGGRGPMLATSGPSLVGPGPNLSISGLLRPKLGVELGPKLVDSKQSSPKCGRNSIEFDGFISAEFDPDSAVGAIPTAIGPSWAASGMHSKMMHGPRPEKLSGQHVGRAITQRSRAPSAFEAKWACRVVGKWSGPERAPMHAHPLWGGNDHCWRMSRESDLLWVV